jgi:hypothetical protein
MINNHGCWGKHAHIPDNDYSGICLVHVVWTAIFVLVQLYSKSKSQNIWQQIILFSRTVMQMIYAWPKIWTLPGRLSLMRTVQLIKKMSDASKNIFFRLFWSDDCRSWPRDEMINNHGCWGKHALIPDNDCWGFSLFHVVLTILFGCNYSYVVHTEYIFTCIR